MTFRNPLFVLFEFIGKFFHGIAAHFEQIICGILCMTIMSLTLVFRLPVWVETLQVCFSYFVGFSFFQWKWNKGSRSDWESRDDRGFLLLGSAGVTVLTAWLTTFLLLLLLI